MRYEAIEYAKRFIGLPYIWGGDDPIKGFDCSGFIQEILVSVGLDPKGDQTAKGLMDYFNLPHRRKEGILPPGSLLFFGVGTQATHVAMHIGKGIMIEAGGGRSTTKTAEDAANQNAYIRQRLVSSRKDLMVVLDPFG